MWLSIRSDDTDSEYASRSYFIQGIRIRIENAHRSILYVKISTVANDGECYTLRLEGDIQGKIGGGRDI